MSDLITEGIHELNTDAMIKKIIEKYTGDELAVILKNLETNNFPCRFGDLKGLRKIELVYYLKHCLDQKEPNEIQGVSRKKLFEILGADLETQEVLNDFFNTRIIIDDKIRQKEFTNIAEMVEDADLLLNVAVMGEFPCNISDLDKFDSLDKKIEYIKYCVNRATDKIQSLSLEDLAKFDERTLNELYNNIDFIVMNLGLTTDEQRELYNVLNIAHLFREVVRTELVPTTSRDIEFEVEENPFYYPENVEEFEEFENPLYE